MTIFSTPSILHGRVYFMTSDEPLLLRQEDRKAAGRPAAAGAEGDAGRGWREAGADPGRPGRRDARARRQRWTSRPTPSTRTASSLGAVKVDWKLGPMHPPVYPPGITPPPPLPGSPPVLKGTLERGERRGDQADDRRPGAAVAVRLGRGDARRPQGPCPRPRGAEAAVHGRLLQGARSAARRPRWVNTQGKYSVIEGPQGVADHPIFSKRNNNPNILVARANAYIGAPTLSDYTIEVDEYGTKVKTDMPDMGCRQLSLRVACWRQRPEAAPRLLGRPEPHRRDHRVRRGSRTRGIT